MLAFSRSSISTHWWNALRFRSSCKTRDLYHLYRVLSPRQWFSTTDAKKDQGDKREEISGPNKSEDSTSYKVQDSWSLLLGSRTKIIPPKEIDVLNHINVDRHSVRPGRIPLLLLLVTPSFIKFLGDDGHFVPELLRRLFKPSESGQKFDVVMAVVDRIPYPMVKLSSARKIFGLQRRYGCEGISALISDSESTAPDLWSPRKRNNNQQSTVSEPSVISLKFKTNDGGPSSTEKNPSSCDISRTFQLPLANTLFQNGRISTLFAARWISVPAFNPSLDFVFVRTELTELSQQTFNLKDARNNLDYDLVDLVIKLKQLTLPRVVSAALGNIVRKITKGENLDEEVPASEHLEKSVGRLLSNGLYPNQPTLIWALVTPRECRTDRPAVITQRLQDKIERGSRLHRVLSGGGGWGAKEGLLALDPAIQYANDQDETQQGLGDGEDMDAERAQSLRNIVKPGDIITFYTQGQSPIRVGKPRIKTKRRLRKGFANSWNINIFPSIHIGTISSPTETVSCFNDAADEVSEPSEFIFIRSHFGMLSERGMSLKVDVGPSGSAEPFGPVVTTKIDPPFSFYSTARVGLNPRDWLFARPEGIDQPPKKISRPKKKNKSFRLV